MNTDLQAFETRRQHAANKISANVPAELIMRGRFLDIGCGVGNGIVAALQVGFEQAVGIDRDFGEFVWFDVGDFDRICEHYGVDSRRSLLIQGDPLEVSVRPQAFD